MPNWPAVTAETHSLFVVESLLAIPVGALVNERAR